MGESKVVSFEGTYLRASGIVGQVTADEEPQEGVTVSLQGRGENRSVTTNATGQYAFEQLRRGDYSVVISGYDTDEMSFDVTSQSVTVAYGETANVPFEGVLLRTAGIRGTVAVEGVGPLSGVTVAIAGEGESDDRTTDANGEYLFEGLPAGDYSVSITGFDDDQYGFPDGTSATVTVELKETGTVPFDGIMLRTAAIEGTVTVGDDDAPLAGVMVTVNGGPRDEEHSTSTNDDGMYMVENLHAGVYSVSISGYDTNEYGFNPTIESVDVGLRETAEVAFQGDLLRTAGVSGRVHVDGMGLEGVTVTMTGEEDREGMTDADGQYGFSGLAAGDYTLTISGWDEVEYAFEPTMAITLELDESMSGVNFAGKALRTATVMGYVTVEEAPLPGIVVTLIKVISANSGEIIGSMPTGDDGGYSFGPLLAGAYQVMIAGYADEHDFADGTDQTTVVMTDGTAEVNFAATIIRTAAVSGMVTVDGVAMADIEVTLTGDHAPDDNTMMTGDDGMYGFGGLRKGNYTVTVTNPDEESYSFPSLSQAVNLSVGQEQGGISFAGARLKQASISGQVHAEGTPIEGVAVTLSGDADAEDVTDANGEYNFPGLAGGDYMVTIAGWDEAAYEFASTEAPVEGLGTDEFKIVDFAGMHTRTASIGGMLYIDAGDEPVLDLDAVLPMGAPGLPITLLGPELGNETPGFASRQGMYSFDGLRAGSYVLSIDVETEIPLPTGDTTTVEAVLTMLGYEYTGEPLYNVTVAAAEEGTQNLPFEITMQTINVHAVMGTPEAATETMVGGVELALFPTAEAADAGGPMLGTGTTDSLGVATFHFPRAMDLGPGGQATTDHLVFAKVTSTGHDDLAFSDNEDIEIQYAATDRVSNALAAARLVNVQVHFRWSVRSKAEAKDGDEPLGGWGADNGMEADDDGYMSYGATDAEGSAAYSGQITVAEAIEGAGFEVMLAVEQDDSVTGRERWTQSDALMHEHDPLALPAENTLEMNDVGTIHVTWTTQSLTLGVYREADDTEGYTDYRSALPSGDVRPHKDVGAGMIVQLMTRDSRNRLRLYDAWDHDCDDDGEKEEPTDARDAEGDFENGMITFRCLPTSEEFTVRYRAGAGREQMDYGYDEIETFGDDLDFGVTVGSFGDDMGGAGPEVRMCSASDPMNPDATTDEWCATFAYQWNTGSVHGRVGREKGHTVTVEPETGHGAIGDEDETAADNRSTAANEAGTYGMSDFQDGVYTLEATSGDAKYRIVGRAKVEGVALYHDEACWANPNPGNNACSAGELVVDEIEDDDTTWAYVNEHVQIWNTGRLALAIRGYVANDGQDGEGRDNLLRGDESMAGITMTLYDSDNERAVAGVDPVETHASGFYEFEGLAEGRYTVRAGSASNARAFHAIALDEDDEWEFVTSKSATAEDYTVSVDEADLGKPYWVRQASGTMGNGTTMARGTGPNPPLDTYYNFALVYTDGQLTGSVENISDGSDDIDLVFSSPFPFEDDLELTTDRRGNFEISGLMEAIGYTAVIEDAGFAAPCLNAAGMPDDDNFGDHDENPDTPDECLNPADTELTADVLGEDDHQNMGTLIVYETDPEATDDNLDSVTIRGGANFTGADFDTATAWAAGWNRNDTDNAEETRNTSSIGTTTYKSRTVTVSFGLRNAAIPEGASVALDVNGDADACTGTRCTLSADTTNSVDGTAGTNTMEDTITVTVTAANGYDDHIYSTVVGVAPPVGANLAAGNIAATDSAGNTLNVTGGSNNATNVGDAFIVATAAGETTVNIVFGLTVLGSAEAGNAYCAHAKPIAVRPLNGNALAAEEDDDDDVCTGTRYTLSGTAAGQVYEIDVTSEDGVTITRYLRVTATAGTG